MAKLNKNFYAVIPGQVYPKLYKANEECPPELEAVARSAGYIAEVKAPAPRKSRKGAKND